MTDQQRAIALLEQIQENFLEIRYGSNYLERFGKRYSLDEVIKGINEFVEVTGQNKDYKDEIIKNYESFFDEQILRSKYEIPSYYLMLHKYLERIDKAASELNISATSKPYIGTALSKNFNAFACRIPNTKANLIIFESEIFTLCNLLAKIIVSCFPNFQIKKDRGTTFSFKKENVVQHINENPILVERFHDFVYNTLYSQPSRSEQYFLDDYLSKLSYEILYSLELFIVGHEYGHITCGHLDNAATVKQLKNELEIEQITPSWKMEFEADEIGLNLMITALNQEGMFPFYLMGAELFFFFLDIVERASSFYNSGIDVKPFGSDTHPPSHLRSGGINKLISENLSGNNLQSYQIVRDMFKTIIEILWEKLKT